jgi:hypothetical protein
MLRTKNRVGSNCADELRAAKSGRVALPGDELYEKGCRVWNGGPDDREQAAEAYGGNAARLRILKRRFDPDAAGGASYNDCLVACHS